MGDSEEELRIHATHLCEWAGRHHGPSAIPMLIQALEDPDPVIREGAIVGLGHAVADTVAVMALHDGIHENSPGVRMATRDVLGDLAGLLKDPQQEGLDER